MNWVDYCVLGVLAASGLLALMRGFVREILGIGAWIGAALAAAWAMPFTTPYARQWITGKEFVQLIEPASFAAAFIVALIVLLVISHWIGGLVRNSVLGGLDRSLGLLFGLARGALLVVFAYVAGGWLVTLERWPDPVLHARSLPLVAEAAGWAGGMFEHLPEKYRPHIPTLPQVREATAAALLRANPVGRATGPQPANGAPANGAPANGTPANGTPANGAPPNAAPATQPLAKPAGKE